MTTTEQGIREKANTAKARGIIMARLDTHRVPFDCKRCEYEIRCTSLAPARAVLCELSDDDIGLPLVSPRDGDGESRESQVEENATYYLTVHVIGA